MRITGGQARGIPLLTGRATAVRPATDKMREAVFSSLGERVAEARFLDLFAGSGSYGLEAFSRGASSGTFVEKDPRALEALRQNLAAVMKSLGHPPDRPATVLRQDALRFAPGPRFDLVFADPPYDLVRREGQALVEIVRPLLAEGGCFILEMPADLELPFAGWHCRRRLGKSGTNEPSVRILTADHPGP